MFAKSPSADLASVVKEIDKFVAKNKSVTAVLNFTGESADDEAIKSFAKDNKIENVNLTTTADGAKFKVNEDAEFTLMAYNKKTVVYNAAAEKSGLKALAKEVAKGSAALLE